jgi:hypothetical protein
MQRIGHLTPSQPLAVGKILRRAVWLLIFAAISARADLTISPPEKNLEENLSASVSQPQKFSALELELMTPAKLAGNEPFLIVQKNPGVHDRSNERMLVSAGCGQIWGDTSTLKKICPDHQDPGWAYVKASFSF